MNNFENRIESIESRLGSNVTAGRMAALARFASDNGLADTPKMLDIARDPSLRMKLQNWLDAGGDMPGLLRLPAPYLAALPPPNEREEFAGALCRNRNGLWLLGVAHSPLEVQS